MRDRAALNLLLVVLAATPIVLAVVDFVLAQGNRALQAEVARRQHAIVEGGQLARLDQLLIREMAAIAIKDKDSKLRDLLSRNGVTIKVSPPPASGNGRGG